MQYLGDLVEDQVINFKFFTHLADGTPAAFDVSPTPVIKVYRDESTNTETATGVTPAYSFYGVTGLHNVTIDTSAAAFYSTGSDFSVVITTGTVGGVSVAGTVLATFSIEYRFNEVDFTKLNGTSIAGIASQVATAFLAKFNVATPEVNQTGDTFANLPDNFADLAIDADGNVSTTDASDVATIKTVTDRLGAMVSETALAATTKIIDPAGAGDYLTLELALAGEVATAGDLVLYCRKGKCTNDASTVLEVEALACRSLKILPEAGHGHNGSLSQALADCAYSTKKLTWTPTVETVMLDLEVRGMRFVGCCCAMFKYGLAGKTYHLKAIQNLDEMSGALGADATSSDGVQVIQTHGTLYATIVDNCIISKNVTRDDPQSGYIMLNAGQDSVLHTNIYGNTCNSDKATDIVDGISLYTTASGSVVADVRNNAAFNVTDGAYKVSGSNITITGDYNMADDGTPTTAIGGTHNQESKAVATVLADPLLSAAQLASSPGIGAGVAITQVDQSYLMPRGTTWDIGAPMPKSYAFHSPAVAGVMDVAKGDHAGHLATLPTNTQFELRSKLAAEYADKTTLDTAAADAAAAKTAAQGIDDIAGSGTGNTLAGAVNRLTQLLPAKE